MAGKPCERGVLHAEFTGILVPRNPGIGGRGLPEGPDLFLGGRTTFSGHYVTRPRVTLMKPGMICSLPSLAMSLIVEFGIPEIC
jgi:hypothetical protein